MSGYIKTSAPTVVGSPFQVGTNVVANIRGPVEVPQATVIEAVNVDDSVSVGDAVYRDSTNVIQQFVPYAFADATASKPAILGIVIEKADHGDSLSNRVLIQTSGVLDITGFGIGHVAAYDDYTVLYAGTNGSLSAKTDTFRVASNKVRIPVAMKLPDNKIQLLDSGLARALSDSSSGGLSEVATDRIHVHEDLTIDLNRSDASNSTSLFIKKASSTLFRISDNLVGSGYNADFYAGGGTFQVHGGPIRGEQLIISGQVCITDEDDLQTVPGFSANNTGTVVKTRNIYNTNDIDFLVTNGDAFLFDQINAAGNSRDSILNLSSSFTQLDSDNIVLSGETYIGSSSDITRLNSSDLRIGTGGTDTTISLQDDTLVSFPSSKNLVFRTPGGGNNGHIRFKEADTEDASSPNGNQYAAIGAVTDYGLGAAGITSQLTANSNPSLLDGTSGRFLLSGRNPRMRMWDGSGEYLMEIEGNKPTPTNNNLTTQISLSGGAKLADGVTDNPGQYHGRVYAQKKISLVTSSNAAHLDVVADASNQSHGYSARVHIDGAVILDDPIIFAQVMENADASVADASSLSSSQDLIFRLDKDDSFASSQLVVKSGHTGANNGGDLIFRIVGELNGTTELWQDNFVLRGSANADVNILITDAGGGTDQDRVWLGVRDGHPELRLLSGPDANMFARIRQQTNGNLYLEKQNGAELMLDSGGAFVTGSNDIGSLASNGSDYTRMFHNGTYGLVGTNAGDVYIQSGDGSIYMDMDNSGQQSDATFAVREGNSNVHLFRVSEEAKGREWVVNTTVYGPYVAGAVNAGINNVDHYSVVMINPDGKGATLGTNLNDFEKLGRELVIVNVGSTQSIDLSHNLSGFFGDPILTADSACHIICVSTTGTGKWARLS